MQAETKRRRTWSQLGDLRRMPSEYEIVTHDTNYTTRKGRNAALEQNSSSPMNLWFLTYRDKSPLALDDWSTFRDPDQLTYRRYVALQAQRENAAAAILGRYAEIEHDAKASPAWRATLAALFTPMRFPGHALQMCHSYLAGIAPASYVTNCAAFAAADQLRLVSLVAYRTRELERAAPGEGFGSGERERWENGPAWQGTRKALELALTSYDWGESFTAVNLVLRPTLDEVLLRQFAQVAEENGDDETFLLLTDLYGDAERCRRWSAALARHAVEGNPQNAAVLRKWIDRWEPRADEAAAGLAELLATLPPNGRTVADTVAAARSARANVFAEASLSTAR
jgi:toluene monooxygenase system protein E